LGRTVPSFRIALEAEIREWGKFRRVLRGGDRDALNDIFCVGRCYASAALSAVRLFRFEGLLMAVLLEHSRMLMDVASEIEARHLEEVEGL
jgi:hypothetical protein